MGDKDIYKAEDAMFGKWGRFSNFKQWLNEFLTRHGCKPKDIYVYEMPGGERVVIECLNIVEVLMSTAPQMHSQIKLMFEMKEKAGVDIREWLGQMGAHFYSDGYFDRDPRFKKAKMKVK
jgi:hypothetical protein